MRGRVLLLAAALAAAGLTAGGCSAAAWAAGSGNSTNDRLLAMPEAQQAQALANSLHKGCTGVAAFPMGVTTTGHAKGYAYWSVRCKDGKSYAVQIPPRGKRAVVVACQALQGTGHECFKKF
jgi:hypothetical protein